jgi:hypothetical protein
VTTDAKNGDASTATRHHPHHLSLPPIERAAGSDSGLRFGVRAHRWFGLWTPFPPSGRDGALGSCLNKVSPELSWATAPIRKGPSPILWQAKNAGRTNIAECSTQSRAEEWWVNPLFER